MTIQDAMAIAHVSRRTIYVWLKNGKLDFVRTAGGKVRIYVDSLHQADLLYVARPADRRKCGVCGLLYSTRRPARCPYPQGPEGFTDEWRHLQHCTYVAP